MTRTAPIRRPAAHDLSAPSLDDANGSGNGHATFETRVGPLLTTLVSVTRATIEAATRQELLDGLCSRLVASGLFSMAGVVADVAGDGALPVVALAGDEGGIMDGVRISRLDVPEGRTTIGAAARTARPAVEPDTLGNPRFAPFHERMRRHGIRSTAALPMHTRSLPFAVLAVYAPVVGAFGPEEMAVLEDLADTVGLAVDLLAEREARAVAEASERSTRDLLQALISSSPDLIWAKDLDGRYLLTNPTTDYWNGRTPAESLGRTDVEIFGPEVAADYLATDAAARDADAPVTTISEEVAPDGRRVWWSVSKGPIRGADGRSIGTFGVAHDITRVVEAEAAHRETRELLDALVGATPDLIWVKDLDGRYLLYNRAAQEWNGLTPEQVIGRTDADIYHPEKAAMNRAHDLRVLADGRSEAIDAPSHRADGQLRWVSILKGVMRDAEGTPTGTFGVGRDITDKVEAERHEQEALFLRDAVLASTPDAVYVKDTDGRYRLFNAAAGEWTRREAASVIGLTDDELFPPVKAAEFREEDRRILATGEPLHQQREMVFSDGRRRWVDSTKGPIRDASGAIVGVFGVNRDITAEREAAEAVRRTELTFHQALSAIDDPVFVGRAVRDDTGAWLDEQVVFANRAWCREYVGDADAQLSGLMGREFLARYPRPVIRERIEVHRGVIETGEARRVTFTSDVSGRQFDIQFVKFGDGILGIHRDITDLVEGRSALEASERRFRTTLDQMLEGAAIIDRDLRILYTNGVTEREGFRRPDGLEGRSLLDVIPGVETTETFARLQLALAGEPQSFETRFAFGSGEPGWYEFHMSPVPEGVFVLGLDIGPRKAAEAALAASETRYRATLDSMMEGAFLFDRDWRVLYLNAPAVDHSRMDPDLVLGKPMLKVYPRFAESELFARFAEVMDGRVPSRFQLDHHFPDGRVASLDFSVTPVPDGIFVVSLDVTEKLRAERALRESETRFRTTLDAMQEAGAILSPDWRLVYANDAHRAMSRPAIPGSDSLLERYPGIERTELFERLGQVMETRTPQRFEHEWTYPDGRKAWLEISVSPVPEGIFVASIDITERVRTEAALRESEDALRRSEAQFRTVFEDAPIGIALIDAATETLIEANRAYLEITGRTVEQLRAVRWEDVTHPDDRERQREVMAAIWSGEASAVQMEKRYLRPDGSAIWVDMANVYLPAIDGMPRRRLAMVRDINDAKLAAVALKDSETRLRGFVDANVIGVVMAYPDGRILEANDYYLNVIGRTRAELEAGTIDWKAITPGEYAEVDATAVAAASRDGRSGPREKEYLRPDGTRVPVLIAHASVGDVMASFVLDLRERQALETEIRSSEARMHGSLDALIDPFLILTPMRGRGGKVTDFRIDFANRAGGLAMGTGTERLIGEPLSRMPVLRIEGRSIPELAREVLETGERWAADAAAFRLSVRGIEVRGFVAVQVARFGDGVFVSWHDLTDEETTRRDRERLMTAVEEASDLVLVADEVGRVRYASGALLASLPHDGAAAFLGRTLADVLGELLGDPTEILHEPEGAGVERRTREVDLRDPDGSTRHLEVAVAPVVPTEGQRSGQVVTIRDVTAIRRAEAAADLEGRVRTSLASVLQVLPESGDLETIATAITDGLVAVPGIDIAAVLAFTGDEELVQLAGTTRTGPLVPQGSPPPEMVAELLDRASRGAWATTEIDDQIALVPGMVEAGIKALSYEPIVHGDHIAGLLAVATADPALVSTLVTRMPTVGDLSNTMSVLLADRIHDWRRVRQARVSIERAIAEGGFRAVFQPIVDLESEDVVGYEALTRFEGGQRPDQAFREAWEVGLGAELELATIRAAVAAAKALPAGRWLDVNVSPRLIYDPTKLAAILRAADRPVVLEITEHEVINDYQRIREATQRIGRDTRLAVDDAGAGIANFTHIVELRADFVKLDMSLVRDINVTLGRQALVKGMVHFSRASGCRLIAEGIENAEEAATLTLMGVEFGQGFLFGRAEPAEVIAEKARAGRRSHSVDAAD